MPVLRAPILINNHFILSPVMNVKTALNNELLAQDFAGEVNLNRYLTHYKQVASMYAEVENSIAVLSDMGSNRSYIYYGKVGEF